MRDYDLTAFEAYITAIRSKATAHRYGISVSNFLNWLERAHSSALMTQLPPSTLSEYSMAMLEDGYMPSSVHSQLAAVQRYFRWLREKKGMAIVTFHRVELPKRKRKIKDALSPEQLTHYFRVANELEEPLRSAVMLLPCSGLRSQEIVELPLQSLKRISFQQENGTQKNLLCLMVKGKGGNERTVPLFEEGAEILLGYLREWRREHSDQEFLFPGRYKGHLSTRALRDAVQKIRGAFKALWTPHTMRRTYLTTLYRRGMPVTTLAKIGGHSVQVLVEYYLALDDHDVVRAFKSAGARLAP